MNVSYNKLVEPIFIVSISKCELLNLYLYKNLSFFYLFSHSLHKGKSWTKVQGNTEQKLWIQSSLLQRRSCCLMWLVACSIDEERNHAVQSIGFGNFKLNIGYRMRILYYTSLVQCSWLVELFDANRMIIY